MGIENNHYRTLATLREVLVAGGQTMLASDVGCSDEEWDGYLRILHTLNRRSHPTRGSHLAAARFGHQLRALGDSETVAFFLAGLAGHHEVFLSQQIDATMPTQLQHFFGCLTGLQRNADIYVKPEERQKITTITQTLFERRETVSLINGIQATVVHPLGRTLGFGGIVFVDKSGMPKEQENRGLVSSRQKAAKGRVVHKAGDYVVEMPEGNYRRIIEPEKIIMKDFEKLTSPQKLVHISRTLRFNVTFPDTQVGRYPLAMRLPETAFNQLVKVLSCITPEDIREMDINDASCIASELMYAFLHHPETVARLLKHAHPHVFPYLNRESLSSENIYGHFGRMMNSLPYLVVDASQRLDLSEPITKLATLEAIRIAQEFYRQLEAKRSVHFDDYQSGLNWHMSANPAAYLVLPLVFSPIRLS